MTAHRVTVLYCDRPDCSTAADDGYFLLRAARRAAARRGWVSTADGKDYCPMHRKAAHDDQ